MNDEDIESAIRDACRAASWPAPQRFWRSRGAVSLVGSAELGLAVPLQFGATTAALPRSDHVISVMALSGPHQVTQATIDELQPDPAAVPHLTVGWALREAGFNIGGASFVTHADLPVGSGAAAIVATASVTAKAFRDLNELALSDDELADAVQTALHAIGFAEVGRNLIDASLRCPSGTALVRRSAAMLPEIVAFGLADAGLRVVIVDTRIRKAVVSARSTIVDSCAVGVACDRAVRGDIRGIGELMTAATDSAIDPRQRTAILAVLRAGAWGARAVVDHTGRPIVALAEASRVPDMRSAIIAEFHNQGWQPPRILTSATLRRLDPQ